MTTFFDFVPSTVAPPQFQPTLDGQQYTCVVRWNIFGQRYYVACFSLGGQLIFNRPLIGSAVGVNIESLSWSLGGSVSLVTTVPHGLKPGKTADLTVSGCVPEAYNGVWRCYAEDPQTLTFQLSTNPGNTTSLGNVGYEVSICANYFASRLVYRTANMQFEVSP